MTTSYKKFCVYKILSNLAQSCVQVFDLGSDAYEVSFLSLFCVGCLFVSDGLTNEGTSLGVQSLFARDHCHSIGPTE